MLSSPEFSGHLDRAIAVHGLVKDLNLPTGGSIAMESIRSLSPDATVAILHGLLIANDETFHPMRMSEISRLECGRTETGDYVWARRDEIDARPDTKLCHDYVSSSTATPAAPTNQDEDASDPPSPRALPQDSGSTGSTESPASKGAEAASSTSQASQHSSTPTGAASPKRNEARL